MHDPSASVPNTSEESHKIGGSESNTNHHGIQGKSGVRVGRGSYEVFHVKSIDEARELAKKEGVRQFNIRDNNGRIGQVDVENKNLITYRSKSDGVFFSKIREDNVIRVKSKGEGDTLVKHLKEKNEEEKSPLNKVVEYGSYVVPEINLVKLLDPSQHTFSGVIGNVILPIAGAHLLGGEGNVLARESEGSVLNGIESGLSHVESNAIEGGGSSAIRKVAGEIGE
jgi:hypothetical protein